MQRIENVRYSSYNLDGIGYGVLDIQVSDTTELPTLGETFFGIGVLAGTCAQIVQTGQWVTLDDDGTWYNQDGSGEV